MRIPYPLFRRLVLWTAVKPGGPSAGESLDYLGKQPHTAVWGLDTRRELLQYFKRVAPLLSSDEAEKLIGLIHNGPPRAQYRSDLSQEDFEEIRDKAIWLRLARLHESGLTLPSKAQTKLDEVLHRHPELCRVTNERDEFAAWMESGSVRQHDEQARLDDYQKWPDQQVIEDLQTNPDSPETAARFLDLLLTDATRALRALQALGSAEYSSCRHLGYRPLNASTPKRHRDLSA